MKKFSQFITEEASDVVFRTDNPGGEWLESKRKYAQTTRNQLGGSITGWFTGNVSLPTYELRNVAGYHDEHNFRQDPNQPKYQRLASHIGALANFDTKSNPILIGVNHHGQPFVLEGNHRLGYALNNGIKRIHAEVRYFNGGEQADGPLKPDTVLRMHKGEQ